MKTGKIILATVLCIGVLGVFTPRQTQAQGTVYVSNTGESGGGSISIASDQWGAMEFTTGGNSTGYTLDSIQYLSAGANNPSDDFNLSLYTDNGGQPGANFGVLSGTSNPASAQTYDYTASDILLSPSTAYWVVAATGTLKATSAYYWGFTDSVNYTSSDGWSMSRNPFFSSNGGSSWSVGPDTYSFQFGVTAEPALVPEPGTLALAAFSAAGFLFLRRKK